MNEGISYLNFIKKYLRPYYGILAIVFLCIFIDSGFYSIIAIAFKYIIDVALAREDAHILVLILSSLGIGGIIVAFISIIADFLYARFVADFLQSIRFKVFLHLQRLSTDFYARYKTGDILSHFSNDLVSVEEAITSIITLALYPFFGLIINIVLLLFLSWKLTIVVLLISPIILIIPNRISPHITEENYKRRKQEAQLLSIAQENIMLQLIIKAFSLFSYTKKFFLKSNKAVAKKTFRVTLLSYLLERSANVVATLLQILILAIGAYMTFHKTLSLGSLVSFQAIFSSMIFHLAYLTNYYPHLMKSLAGIRRIQEFLNEKSSLLDKKTAIEIPPQITQEIALSNINFSYEGKEINLQNINAAIKQGTTVAFVGGSGSGKSTMLSLLMRFYDPQTGSIAIDGIDVRDITQESLHRMMGYIPQEPLLFNATIRENIRLGKLDASDDEIEAAAKAAEIHNDIMRLHDGYDTPLGERGGKLSGGQRQRIAIARAIIRRPPVLVLDEVTASLDPVTEAAVNATLKTIAHGRTAVTVTHRLNSITHADRIYVLNHGKIVEHGTHEELLAKKGFYNDLWEKQHGFIINAEQDEAIVTADKLRTLPLFDHLSKQFLEKSVGMFKTLLYSEGQVIINEGDIGDLFYIIVRGRVSVYKTAKKGEVKTLAVLEDGDHFGEVALLKSVPRTASVKALSPCMCLIVKHRDFMHLIEQSPELQEKLEKIIEERMNPNEDTFIYE